MGMMATQCINDYGNAVPMPRTEYFPGGPAGGPAAGPPQTRIPSSSAVLRDARRPDDLSIPVPPGVNPGDILEVEVPDGRSLQMSVPQGAMPGMEIRVRLDPATNTLIPLGFS